MSLGFSLLRQENHEPLNEKIDETMSHDGKLNSAASLCSGYIAETPKGKGNQWIRLIGAIKSHFSFTIFSPSAKATPSLQVFNDVAYHTY